MERTVAEIPVDDLAALQNYYQKLSRRLSEDVWFLGQAVARMKTLVGKGWVKWSTENLGVSQMCINRWMSVAELPIDKIRGMKVTHVYSMLGWGVTDPKKQDGKSLPEPSGDDHPKKAGRESVTVQNIDNMRYLADEAQTLASRLDILIEQGARPTASQLKKFDALRDALTRLEANKRKRSA